MKKTFLSFIMLACSSFLAAQAQTLSIGDFDSIEEWGEYGGNLYNGSSWECVPINLVYTNSGTQIILTKEELADMAGKNITAFRFTPYDGGSYQEITYNVKVYLAETNRTTFYKNSSNQRYLYFDVSRCEKLYDDVQIHDGYTYAYCDGAPIELTFDTPFYYSGNNNLVVTIIAEDADNTTPGIDYVNFYQTDLTKRAITFSSDKETFSNVLAGDRYAAKTGVSIENAPICQFSYTDGTPMAESWFSYVPTEDEDLQIEGYEAYQVETVDGSYAKLTRVAKAKKGTPLIVCQSVSPTVSPAEGALDNVSNNLLKVSDGTVSGGDNIYALAKKEGTVGFYRVKNTVTIPAGKVYLEVSAGANEVIFIDGMTDGIEQMSTESHVNTGDDAWYNMQGQRVEKPVKGIYIHNGKKTVIK